MSLNIKNERVHALARKAAQITGGTQTGAIEQALLALLREHGHEHNEMERAARVEKLLAMGARFRREEHPPETGILRVEDLYDDVTGLPR